MAYLPSAAARLYYVNEPVIDMREEPSHDSQVVSQTYFSEQITIQTKTGDWVQIVTSDGYTGWVMPNGLVDLAEPYPANLKTSRLKAHIYKVNDTGYGPIKSLPYGSRVKLVDETDPRWIKIALPDCRECYIQKGDVAVEPQLSNKSELPQFGQKFLGLPYTWGGRSSFGYDCSGFVQMLYSQIGIHLQRDAKQQVLDKRFQTIPLEKLEAGDLIFFGKSEDRIMHVGLYKGDGQFIHTSVRENKPWLRISLLSDYEWGAHHDVCYPYRTARQLLPAGY